MMQMQSKNPWGKSMGKSMGKTNGKNQQEKSIGKSNGKNQWETSLGKITRENQWIIQKSLYFWNAMHFDKIKLKFRIEKYE